MGDYIFRNDAAKYELLNQLDEKACESGIDEDMISKLEELSYDENDVIRAEVASILVNAERKKGEEILIRLANDEDSLVRTEACDSLCISESETTYEMLKDIAVKDKVGMVRAYAIISLADIALEIDKEEDLIMFLQEVLKTEKVLLAKINIYSALYLVGYTDYLSELLAMINSKNYHNRCAVANSLYEVVDDDNKDIVIETLLERKKVETAFAVTSTIDRVLKDIEELEDEEEEDEINKV